VIIGKALVLNQYCVANYRSGYFWIWARSRLCISTKRCILYNRRNLEKKKKSIGPGEKLSGDDASGARARPPHRVKIDLYIFRTGRSFFSSWPPGGGHRRKKKASFYIYIKTIFYCRAEGHASMRRAALKFKRIEAFYHTSLGIFF
jgi:hypothetical protein